MNDVNDKHRRPLPYSEAVGRIKQRYTQRDAQMPWQDQRVNIYHPRHPLGFLFYEHHHAILITALNRLGLQLEGRRILDVGCGYGHWLRFLIELGASPECMAGVDISPARLVFARRANPAITWIQTDGSDLPFAAASFDMVLQTVVFSSILNRALRTALADAMTRVTKSNGYIFWIDHQRPRGDGLVGFSQTDALEYFPGTRLVYAMPVQPRYFRFLYRTAGWLARLLYECTKRWCDSWFLIMQKTAGTGGRTV